VKSILELITTVFAFCFGGFLLWHFFQIARFDKYTIYEPNLGILYSEIVACVVVILIAVLNFILLIKSRKGRENFD